MKNNKKYWKGIEELTNDIEFVKNAEKEFPDFLPVSDKKGNKNEEGGNSRRDFLKLMGFGMAAVSLAACETPVKKAIPYLNKPENIDPSIPNIYASTYMKDGEYCSILVKTREGRPIKIEGNTMSNVTKGGTSARVQASLLGLYDLSREQFKEGFLKGGKSIDVEKADAEIKRALQGAQGTIYIVTPTIASPSTKQVVKEFAAKYPNTKHVTYDAVSSYGILKANEESFGVYALPTYDFSKAETFVSVNADFLGTWLSSIEYSRQYAKTRKVNDKKRTMSRHYHFESGMSLSGANADHRIQIKPSQEGLVIAALYNEVMGGKQAPTVEDAKLAAKIKQAGEELKANRGKSLLVCGSNDPSVQVLVNAINFELGNYDSTIDLTRPTYLKLGNDEEVNKMIDAIAGGRAGAVMFLDTNPVYDHPRGKDLAEGLKKVALSISFSNTIDETTTLCKYITPDHHYLESWNDAEARAGMYSLAQPTISPIFKTRQFQDSLLVWSDNNTTYYDYLRSYWKDNLYKGEAGGFENFWVQVLHDGVYEPQGWEATLPTTDEETAEEVPAAIEAGGGGVDIQGDAAKAISDIRSVYKPGGKMELALYQKVGIGSGAMANIPWLQELPDPITKATWDNYLCISISDAKSMEVKQGDIVKVTANGHTVEVPVLVQPGQARGTVSLALGYGRTKAGKVADGVGANAYPFAKKNGLATMYAAFDVAIKKTEKKDQIAQTQTHQTIMGRDIIREADLKTYKDEKVFAKAMEDKYAIMIHTNEGLKKPTEISLWNGHEEEYNRNHWWGMAIDMNSCIGCSACLIGCQTENNVPVVGKEEVINRREMHWIRIDRYYSSIIPKDEIEEAKTIDGYKEMENASEDPEVVFQPMMCQHCNNAPCETVCPVLATTHSSEGLNQMTYNRCIGTRYCANNCPYKVRRFNWFNYTNEGQFKDVNYMSFTDLGKMVLHPDVTVRSRGVMEKCSFCIQRIQQSKLTAKTEKRKIKDGEVKTACQQACPADAIVFGDMNDPDSEIVKVLGIEKEVKKVKDDTELSVVMKEPRAFHVLNEINVKPNVTYLTKIRNKKV